MYFLAAAIISLLPFGVAPISPITAVLPLVVVLVVTMIKDGYEDYVRARGHRPPAVGADITAAAHTSRGNPRSRYGPHQKRYRADRTANMSQFKVAVSGELRTVLSRDLHPGDMVRIARAGPSIGLGFSSPPPLPPSLPGQRCRRLSERLARGVARPWSPGSNARTSDLCRAWPAVSG